MTASMKLVVFDWAGTIVDYGSMAPVMAFVNIFACRDIPLTLEQARGPMGMNKFDHLKTLMQQPGISRAWEERFGTPCSESEMRTIYEDELIPSQLDSIAQACQPIEGLENTVDFLRSKSIKIGTTTGYFPQANELNLAKAREFGFVPDASCCAGEVPNGRPAPDMIHSIMRQTQITNPSCVVKIDDSVPGVQAGLRAGIWSVGITRTGNLVGLDETEWHALNDAEQEEHIRRAVEVMREAGAHYQIESIAQLPGVIKDIEARLAEGISPSCPPAHQS